MMRVNISQFGSKIRILMVQIAKSLSDALLYSCSMLGTALSHRRMRNGKLRSLWGATPILTLPMLARCDRLLGIESQTLVFVTYVVTKNFDINLNKAQNWVLENAPVLYPVFLNLVLAWALLRYDIFHYFNDRGILAPADRMGINPKELKWLSRSGKILFTYTYGADVRTREATLGLGKYNLCTACPNPGIYCMCDDKKGAANINNIRSYATGMLAMGDMLTYVPGCRNMHFWPVDLERLAYVGVRKDWGRPLRVAHVPNHTYFKGTLHLEAAIAKLREEGHEIELIRAQGVPNEKVLEIYADADIVADQFVAGFHGYAALEAMSLGKPVLCFLRNSESMLNSETCPIINADPDTLYDVLKQILSGAHDLVEIGLKGRHYIEHNYSIPAVAARLGELYCETTTLSDLTRRAIVKHIKSCRHQVSQAGH